MKTAFIKRFLIIAMVIALCISAVACGKDEGPTNAGQTAQPTAQPTDAGGSDNQGNDGGQDNASDDNPVVIKWATSVAQAEIDGNASPGAVAINTWIEAVEAESGGSITVELYPGSQLASGTDNIISGLLNGAYEMTQLNTGSWGDYTTAFAAFNVPYLYTDYSVIHAIMDGAFGQSMIDQLEGDMNIKALCYSDIGYRHITSSKGVITSPADMKGLKIRTMSDPIQISSFENLGAAVTPLSVSELFSALQTGMVDAQENPLSTIYSNKFQEVQGYCTLSRHSYTTTLFFMNVSFYDTLSDNQKAAVEAANKASTEASRALLATSEGSYRELLEADGMEFYELSEAEMAAFQEAVAPTWETVKKTMGDARWQELLDAVEAAKN